MGIQTNSIITNLQAANTARHYGIVTDQRAKSTEKLSSGSRINRAAESKIRDTDMATEMVTKSKQDILAQVGESMITQANQNKQGLLNVIGGGSSQ